MRKLFYDGESLKSFDLDRYPESAWTYLSGGKLNDDVWARVPWLYQAVEARAKTVGAMPFVIMRGDEQIAQSQDWKDPTGFLGSLSSVLYQMEQSLAVFGRSYQLKVRNRAMILRLQYLQPETMAPIVKDGKIVEYKRTANSTMTTIPAEDVVSVFTPDPRVEVAYNLTNPLSPVGVAMPAASVLAAIDRMADAYFKRGAIRPTILTVEDMVGGEDDRDRFRKFWKDLVTGIQNAFRNELFAAKITATVIGDGLEALQDNDLVNAKRQDILAALGVPESKLSSSAANYATATEETKAFYRDTIIPECMLIQDALNMQLLRPAGFSLQFKPETLDVFQEEEADRAGSLVQLVSAGVPLETAMQILGYDLSDEQWAAIQAANAPDVPDPQQIQADVRRSTMPGGNALPAETAKRLQPDTYEELANAAYERLTVALSSLAKAVAE